MMRGSLIAVVTVSGLLMRSSVVWGGAPPIDVSMDKITCNTVIGSVKISPVLTATPANTAVDVKGILDGCTDTSNPAVKILTSKFKGTLNATSASCASLTGTVTGSGTIEIKWKSNNLICDGGTNDGTACTSAMDCTGGGSCLKAALAQSTSTLTVTSLTGGIFLPGGPFGGAGYGSFILGVPTVAGAFTGTDGGASTTSFLTTGQDIVPLAGACAGEGLKAVKLGIGTVTLQ